jgi:cell division protein FtsN
VSAGSFANPANAEALVAKLRAQGWKAQVVQVGNYSRVYVGPYSTAARARAAALSLGNGAKAFAAGASIPKAMTKPPARAATKPVEIRLSGSPVYLQVGAYKNLQNAQPAIAKLKAEGYPVQVVQGQWVRVRVGPVSNQSEVTGKLRRLGFDVLEVR